MNWPLPLTPIEELFFVDDRPAYPSSCFIRAGFSGCFDRQKLEAVICTIVRRHPLLAAKVERRDSRLVWGPSESPQPVIVWQSGPAGDGFPPAIRINLGAETGIRFHVVQGSSESTLFIQFHHAVSDAVGIIHLLHEILLEYAGAGEKEALVEQTLGHHFDRWERARRGIFAFPIARQFALAPRQLINLGAVTRLVRRLPSALLPHQSEPHDGSPADDYPAAITARLPPEETEGLQRAARQLRVTVNDLLLRDLFLAIREWRKLQGIHRSNQWLRLAVPMNLRAAEDRDLPASNLISMVFLDRCDLNFDDPGALLRGVRHEMNTCKQRQMSLMFPLALALGRCLPGGLRKHAWANKCLVSSVLSNLGKLFDDSPLRDGSGHVTAGGTTLQTVEMLPPIRPYMSAAFAAGTYAGRLWTTLHYDSRPIRRTQAQDLMSIFHRRILSSSLIAK